LTSPQAHLTPRSNTAKCARVDRSITWLAAAGLLLVALLAVAFRVRRVDMGMAAVPATLAVLVAFVLWARRDRAQILPVEVETRHEE
jgi:hypothetical protein